MWITPFPDGPECTAYSQGALAERIEINAGLHMPELDLHKQHRITVVIEAGATSTSQAVCSWERQWKPVS
ncbi:hypothetical protein [Synechococcus sp. CBW1002]|uniref:hypothetical protein n=1 Tax=Synechococcus sp. CBW1002 TaxID=1353134 RepID=UPI001E4A8F36|nr:hypothetical protein [Synechococcus sp. CBW1002]